MAWTSKMKGSVPCRCDLGERQRTEDDYAKIVGRERKKLSHLPSCPIVEAHNLRAVEAKLERLDEQPALPDPICEAQDAALRAELQASRKRLRKRLERYVDPDVIVR